MPLVRFKLPGLLSVRRQNAGSLNRKPNPGLVIILSAFLWLLPAVSSAAPGYTYEEIYTNQPVGFLKRIAINNQGQVVFTIDDASNIYRVYIAVPGQPPQLVFEASGNSTEDNPAFRPDRIGLNDNGIVAVPLTWKNFDGKETQSAKTTVMDCFSLASPSRSENSAVWVIPRAV